MAAVTDGHAEKLARKRLGGDWDMDGTVSVYLPVDVARQLLIARGWVAASSTGSQAGGWFSPNGGDPVWGTDTALQIALVAEA